MHFVVSVASVAEVGVVKSEVVPVVYPISVGSLREILRTVKVIVELEDGLTLKVRVEANVAGSSAVPLAQIVESVV